jgi:hypothetical protein
MFDRPSCAVVYQQGATAVGAAVDSNAGDAIVVCAISRRAVVSALG